jgi:hypothetical protein
MKFKNRILRLTSKSNLIIELDNIDGQELIPNSKTDVIDTFFYSADPIRGISSAADLEVNSRKADVLSLINEFDLHKKNEIKTYGELIDLSRDAYEPNGLKIGSTRLYFDEHGIKSFSGFKQFLYIKNEETKYGIKTTRSTYWEFLRDLAERNIFIRFPVIIKVEPGELSECKELNIQIYIKFPTENKLKLYLAEKNVL